MAYPVVASNVFEFPNGTTGTVTPPGHNSGELLLYIQAMHGGTGSKNITIDSLDSVAWSSLGSVAGTTASTEYLAAYYQVAGGASTTVLNVATASDWTLGAGYILDITGASTSTAPAVAFATGLDPSAVTPSWGSDTTLWIAACARFTSNATTAPTSYTMVANDGFWLVVADRNNTVSSENPGVFSGGSGLGSVATIAIRPSQIVIPNMVSLYHQMRRRKS